MIILRLLALHVLLCVTYNVNALEYVDKDAYTSGNSNRKEIVNHITEQFRTQSTISQSEIDNLYYAIEKYSKSNVRDTNKLARFQILNQKVYSGCGTSICSSKWFESIKRHMEVVASKYVVPDVDFIIHVTDVLNAVVLSEYVSDIRKFPSFMMSKDLNNYHEKDKLLMPDAYMLDGWDALFADISIANLQYPWDQKIEKIFWRGAAQSRYGCNMNFYHMMPRMTLVSLSGSHPDLIDAKITDTYGCLKNTNTELRRIIDRKFGGIHPKTPEIEHLKFKYLASVDGVTAAWKRVPWIMSSNSVLLKQDSSHIEWFYPALKAYVHYIPMDVKLSDVLQKLEWMKGNDDEVRKISENAKRFIVDSLTHKDIEIQTVILLKEYNKLQGHSIKCTLEGCGT